MISIFEWQGRARGGERGRHDHQDAGVADRGRACRDQAAPSLRAAGAAGAADRGRQRRILRLDRRTKQRDQSRDERRRLRARHRSGDDQHARHAVRRARAGRAPPHSCRSRRSIPAPGEVEHDPEEIWRSVLHVGTCCARRGRTGGGRGHRHHQSARDHGACGSGRPASRSPTPLSGRTAAPPSCAPSSTREGWGAHVAEVDRARHRSLFLGDQACLAARERARARRAGRRGRSVLRHRRQLPPVQAHRRQATCNRRDQRRAHHALRHQDRPMGRAAARPASACRAPCCRRCATARAISA